MTRKENIKKELLKELCFSAQLTRPDFISRHGIRAATVFAALDELKSAGLVCEPGRKKAKTGRKSPIITLNPNYALFAGLELQVNKLTGVIIDSCGKNIVQAVLSLDDVTDSNKLLSAVRQLLLRLKTKLGDNWKNIKGIGFADPGLVDSEKKISLRAVNLPGWQNIDTGQILCRMMNCRESLIIPETVARTFAEYFSRLPESPASLFQMSLGTGIGGGFIKDGELFFGDTYRGMEIGHIVIAPNGPLCQCGNRGCLEAIAGEAGIKRKVSELLTSGVDTELTLNNFSIGSFVEVAGHDRAAMMLANEVCESISLSLATVISLLNPSIIILSGELTKLGQTLTSTIRRTLQTHCFPGALENLSLEISQLDEFAAANAVAIMCRNNHILKH